MCVLCDYTNKARKTKSDDNDLRAKDIIVGVLFERVNYDGGE